MKTYSVDIPELGELRATAPTTQAYPIRLGESIFAHVDPADCILIDPG
jgi:hypothetical protein